MEINGKILTFIILLKNLVQKYNYIFGGKKILKELHDLK